MFLPMFSSIFEHGTRYTRSIEDAKMPCRVTGDGIVLAAVAFDAIRSIGHHVMFSLTAEHILSSFRMWVWGGERAEPDGVSLPG
jgi:hypothetical protein